MPRSIALITRFALAAALGLLLGKVFGDRYVSAAAAAAPGVEVWHLDVAAYRAAQGIGAALGALLGALSASAWLRTSSRAVSLLRGASVGALACVTANVLVGGFNEKFLGALLAFTLLGGLLAAVGARPGRKAPPSRRHRAARAVRRSSLATAGWMALVGGCAGLLVSLVLLAAGPGLAFGLVFAAPPFGALLGFAVGVLLPARGEAVSARRVS